MSLELHLSIYPRARNQDKARNAIARVQKRLPIKLRVKNIERNYQDKSTFRVDCTVPLRGKSPQNALYESLCICQNISICWVLFGPEKRTDGHWEFHAHALEHQIGVQGIKYAAFTISDGPIPELIVLNVPDG